MKEIICNEIILGANSKSYSSIFKKEKENFIYLGGNIIKRVNDTGIDQQIIEPLEMINTKGTGFNYIFISYPLALYKLKLNNNDKISLVSKMYGTNINKITKFRIKWALNKYWIQKDMFIPWVITTIIAAASLITQIRN